MVGENFQIYLWCSDYWNMYLAIKNLLYPQVLTTHPPTPTPHPPSSPPPRQRELCHPSGTIFVKIYFFRSRKDGGGNYEYNFILVIKGYYSRYILLTGSSLEIDTLELHQTFTCSKSTIEVLEKGVKYVQI